MPTLLQESTRTLAEATTKITRDGGLLEVEFITPGWGSSGYYSREVLEAAAPLFKAGTHCYFDHPSTSEDQDRPERSVRDLAAVLEEDGYIDPSTGGLRGKVRPLKAWKDLLTDEAFAKNVGMSIRGSATDIVVGEAEGRRGPIVEGLADLQSVDFVTRAGRGGRVMAVLESARLAEVRNIGQWVESRIHRDFTVLADDMAGDGRLTREERIGLSSAIGDALGAFVKKLEAEQPQLYTRDLYDEPNALATEESSKGVPATRPDSNTPTTKESQEVPMGKIEIDEAEHTRLVEAAGRVDTLESERDTEKARADAAEKQLTEAKTTSKPRTPREVMEARDADMRQQVATLSARERARDIIGEELAEAWLAPATVARLSSELLESLPLSGDDFKLDEQALRGRCVERRDQHEFEAAEALNAAGVGTPRGLGSLRPAARVDEAAAEGALKTAFQSFGLSESAADTAAKGR